MQIGLGRARQAGLGMLEQASRARQPLVGMQD
jgi:hypothetical protein